MIAMPLLFRSWMIWMSSCISSAVRLLLGSSMMMSFESKDSALAISTICLSETLSSDTSLWVSTLDPMLFSRALALEWTPARPPDSLNLPRKMFSPTVIVFTRFSSW